MTDLTIRRVAPFGHPGITVCVQLPQAYRSLPRPSSPLDAKASTVCLIAFDLRIYLLLNHIIQKKEQSVLGILTYGPRERDPPFNPTIVKEQRQV